MPKANTFFIEQLVSGQDDVALADYLKTTSNLPGPRGNLESAAAVASALAAADSRWALETIERWSTIGPDTAGGNEPAVMLPFAAAQAAGARWPRSNSEERAALDLVLRRAANDPRWRVREGAATGLQRIGFDDFGALEDVVERWQADASLLEQRAIVAGLAEPPLLTSEDRAVFGMRHAAAALDALLATPAPERKQDDAIALRKALGYALSVFIAAAPVGFEELERIARITDAHAAWIVRENLKKARIAKKYPARCAQIAAILDA